MIEQMNASDNREERERLARRATSIAYVGKIYFTCSSGYSISPNVYL